MRVETANNEGALARVNHMKLIIDSTSLIEILQYSFGAKDSTPKHLWSLRYLSQPRLSSSTQTRILKY